jgi:hypothetical protein
MIQMLRISKTVMWEAEAWIGHGIVSAVALHITEFDSGGSIARRLERALSDKACQEIDLSLWTDAEYRSFCRAAAFACRIQRRRGAAAWYEPESFPPYIEAFQELLTLLSEDSRYGPGTMDITFRDVFDGLQALLERDRAWQREGRIPTD